jgi:FkbM family methyltransferase
VGAVRDREARVKTVRLGDGTEIYCLSRPEARALDAHTGGYFRHGVDVRPGDVVFDVGANIGLFGVRVAQRTGGKARVFGFEPVPPIHAIFAANAERHGLGAVRSMACALAEAPGEMEISYYPRSPALSTSRPEIWDGEDHLTEAVLGGARTGTAGARFDRLMPRVAARWIAGFLRGRVERVKCPVRTVPEMRRELGVERIDMLKVDVEGCELDVLRGLGDDPDEWRRVGAVVVEVHDLDGRVERIRALLEQHGFDRIVVEAEDGFDATVLRNVYATRATPTKPA